MTGLQLIHNPRPEFGAFVLLEPKAENLLGLHRLIAQSIKNEGFMRIVTKRLVEYFAAVRLRAQADGDRQSAFGGRFRRRLPPDL